MQPTRIERRLRWSSLLVGTGLMVELISMLWNHPTAFFLFLGVGVSLMTAGILVYFYALLAVTGHSRTARSRRSKGL